MSTAQEEKQYCTTSTVLDEKVGSMNNRLHAKTVPRIRRELQTMGTSQVPLNLGEQGKVLGIAASDHYP